jgi:D-alanine-D-alanine ligase
MEILTTIFNPLSQVTHLHDGTKPYVAILAGGMSSERYVSNDSSQSVIKALIGNNYTVTKIDPGADLASVLLKLKPDVVYNCLHGTYGEDGCVPGLLNMMRLPYTHSGLLASSIAFNKLAMRRIFASDSDNTLKLTDFIVVNKNDKITSDPLPRPYVIKPLDQGSSVGVEVIFPEDDFNFANYNFTYGNQILVEKYIKGQEVQVAVLNGKALGALEIKVLKNRFYDYQAKYTQGFAEHIFPANLPEAKIQEALKVSEYVFNFLGCNGAARVEFLYDKQEDQLYFLEINTHPGMTSLSIVPEIAMNAGISFDTLIEEIISSAKYEL